MTMTCAIIDDEVHALDLLESYIARTPFLQLKGRFSDPLLALGAFNQPADVPEIIFLDIHMPGLSGLGLAKTLAQRSSIIFTTSYRDHGPEAFDLNAADYLLKPFLYERFLQAVQRRQPVRPEPRETNTAFIKTGVKGHLLRVRLEDVRFVSACENYTELHTDKGKHIVYLTMSELLSQLPAELFLRVHRSYIINRSRISALKGGQVQLDNEQLLPIGRAFRADFMQAIAANMLVTKRT